MKTREVWRWNPRNQGGTMEMDMDMEMGPWKPRRYGGGTMKIKVQP